MVTWVDFVRALYEYLDETPLPRVYDVDEVRYLKGRGHGGPIGPHASPDDLAYKCLKALLGTLRDACSPFPLRWLCLTARHDTRHTTHA